MKTLAKNRMGFNGAYVVFALIFISVCFLPVSTSAQQRERGRQRVKERTVIRNVPRHNMVRPVAPMRDYAKVSVAGRNYFYRGGAFYRRDRIGYHVIVAPFGARVAFLPPGYRTFRFGALDYYYFNGIYYNYLPDQNVYVVVQKPANVDNPGNLKLDQIKLYDGSTLNGVFQGATDSTVTLLVNNEDRVINIGDIISIKFAPTINDSTEQK
jgi:hypothetical protein